MIKRKHQHCWLRLIAATMLFAYITMLACAHIHVALEDHHGTKPSSHPQSHCHAGSADEHAPHSAEDHELADSATSRARGEAPTLAFAVAWIVEDLIAVQPHFEPANLEVDIPKHPPPRQPGQPRSPPLA